MRPKLERYELNDPELADLVSTELDAWLDSWTAEEQASYGGQYVAVSTQKEIVASDKSATSLQRKLEKLGVKKVRIFYMEPPNSYAIYTLRS
jgi:hypothetical protein